MVALPAPPIFPVVHIFPVIPVFPGLHIETVLPMRGHDIDLMVIPAQIIRNPALCAAKFKIPVGKLSSGSLQALGNLMAHVVGAVHQQITAAARTQKLSAQCSRLHGFVVEGIHLGISNLRTHPLFALPTDI